MRTIPQLRDLVDHTALHITLCYLTGDPKFKLWPASLSYHHAYQGGLEDHTREVCEIALSMVGPHTRQVNKDVLITAALLHDFAKISEYELTAKTETESRQLDFIEGLVWRKRCDDKAHPHIEEGAELAVRMLSKQEYPDSTQQRRWMDTVQAIEHCILAHHGRKEWGSPIEPQSVEALILHQADMLSAKYGACKNKPAAERICLTHAVGSLP